MKIKITFSNYSVEAELNDTPTAKAIYEAAPFEASANTWGDEIYFEVAAQETLEEKAKADVEVGELAYWPTMPAFCIFFGPTPMSVSDKPRAASEVNVFGKLDEVDIKALRNIRGGEKIVVEVAE